MIIVRIAFSLLLAAAIVGFILDENTTRLSRALFVAGLTVGIGGAIWLAWR